MIGGVCRPPGIPLSTAMNIVNIPWPARKGQTSRHPRCIDPGESGAAERHRMYLGTRMTQVRESDER